MLLEENTQEFLNNTFPCLNTPILFEEEKMHMLKKNYDIAFISAFNHWLTAEECDQVTMCFSAFKENNDFSYLEREKRFLEFYEALFSMGVYFWEENKNFTKVYFNKFNSKKEYLDACSNSVREKKFLNICVPKLQTVICGGFDLTQKILMRKGKGDNGLEKIVEDKGLYMLQ